MKTEYLIIGSGISALFSAMKLSQMGKDFQVVSMDKDVIPAKLHYFHSDISGLLPFPLRRIDVVSNVLWKGKLYTVPTIEMMNQFSLVTTGTIFQNSMKFIDGKIHHGWVPIKGMESLSDIVIDHIPEFIQRLKHGRLIRLEKGFAYFSSSENFHVNFERCISTIPLPIALGCAGLAPMNEYRTEPLKMVEVTFAKKVMHDLYQVVYMPEADYGYCRFSILGDRVVAEKATRDFEATEGENKIGIKKIVGKILGLQTALDAEYKDVENPFARYIPIPEEDRLRDILSLELIGVYQVGRFAEWAYRRTEHVFERLKEVL